MEPTLRRAKEFDRPCDTSTTHQLNVSESFRVAYIPSQCLLLAFSQMAALESAMYLIRKATLKGPPCRLVPREFLIDTVVCHGPAMCWEIIKSYAP